MIKMIIVRQVLESIMAAVCTLDKACSTPYGVRGSPRYFILNSTVRDRATQHLSHVS